MTSADTLRQSGAHRVSAAARHDAAGSYGRSRRTTVLCEQHARDPAATTTAHVQRYALELVGATCVNGTRTGTVRALTSSQTGDYWMTRWLPSSFVVCFAAASMLAVAPNAFAQNNSIGAARDLYAAAPYNYALS